MYIIKPKQLYVTLKCVIFGKENRYLFSQCFCLDDLNVNVTNFEPTFVGEEKQSRSGRPGRNPVPNYNFAVANTFRAGGRYRGHG